MPGQNVELVGKVVDGFNAFMNGALTSSAFTQLFDPQVEVYWRDRQTYPDAPQHIEGISAAIAFGEQYRDGWADLIAEPLEIIDVPGDRVLVLTRQSGRGRESGVPIVIHFFQLWTIRDDKVCRIDYFRHRADALEAAGLSE